MPLKLFVLCVAVLTALAKCGRSNPLNLAGINFAILSSDSTVLDFGTNAINTPKTLQVTIRNLGSNTATHLSGSFALSVFQFSGGSFPGLNGTCKNLLTPRETCIIEVSFNANYTSSFEDFLRIDYFDGEKNTFSSSPILRGTSVSSIP